MKSAMKLGLLAGAFGIGIAGTVLGQPGPISELQMATNDLHSAMDHVRVVA